MQINESDLFKDNVTWKIFDYTLYIYIYIYIFKVKASVIPCPHQPPTKGDNTVSVAQGGTATPVATKRLLPPDRVWRELYIYIPDHFRQHWTLISVFSVQLAIKKNAFTSGRWCYYAFTVTVSYVMTREWWFRVYFIYAENFSLSTESNLMHIAPWSEDDLRQLTKCGQWFLFLKETKWLSVPENHDNQPQ